MRRGKQPPGSEVRRAEEVRIALDGRIAGMSHRAIAEMLGVSIGTVTNRLEEGYSLIKTENIEEARKVEAERLDYLQSKLVDAVMRGDIRAINTAKAISESRRRLFGLDQDRQTVDVTVTETTQEDLELAAIIREAKARNAIAEDKLRAASNGHRA